MPRRLIEPLNVPELEAFTCQHRMVRDDVMKWWACEHCALMLSDRLFVTMPRDTLEKLNHWLARSARH